MGSLPPLLPRYARNMLQVIPRVDGGASPRHEWSGGRQASHTWARGGRGGCTEEWDCLDSTGHPQKMEIISTSDNLPCGRQMDNKK